MSRLFWWLRMLHTRTSFNKFDHGKCHKSINLRSIANCLHSVNSWNYGNRHALWGELSLGHFHHIQPMECSLVEIYGHTKHDRVTNDNRSPAELHEVKDDWSNAYLTSRMQNTSLQWVNCRTLIYLFDCLLFTLLY